MFDSRRQFSDPCLDEYYARKVTLIIGVSLIIFLDSSTPPKVDNLCILIVLTKYADITLKN